MLRKAHPARTRDAGFTLMELLIVVIIIGILAAIAIPVYMNQKARGGDAQVVAQANAIVKAIEISSHDDLRGELGGDQALGHVTFGGEAAQTVPTTDGVEWAVSGTPATYCVDVWANSASPSKYTVSDPLVWSSATGGQLPAGVECLPGIPGGPPGGGGGPGPDPDGALELGIAFTVNLDAPGCDTGTIAAPFRDTANGTIDWGDGTVQPAAPWMNHTYAPATGTFTVTLEGTFSAIAFGEDPTSAACLLSVDEWEGDTGPVSLELGFSESVNLTHVATPRVPITHMGMAFAMATNFNQDISPWDVSGVQEFGAAFALAPAFNQPLAAWNTSSATSMQAMFNGASAFNQDLSGWDTSNVTYMAWMFQDASAFNRPIGGWDTSSATDMQGMFSGASAFNQPLGTWDLANTESIGDMFAGATSFNQDLTGWNSEHIWSHWGYDSNTPAWEAHNKPQLG